MALKSILAISFAVRSLPDSLRAASSKSGIVFSAAEADPAQHSFVPLRGLKAILQRQLIFSQIRVSGVEDSKRFTEPEEMS